jgi:hypothetical protein
MRDSWLTLVDSVLRPARARTLIERMSEERARHVEGRKLFVEARTRALKLCESRIEAARAKIFAADDGVVGALMTDLEREWRTLSRPDPEAGMMDLWARIAPPAWTDRKRWRDGRRNAEPSAQVDVAVALAADVAGVEKAEAAVGALRTALAPFGVRLGTKVEWRAFERDFAGTETFLAWPLLTASEALGSRDGGTHALERAKALADEVHDRAATRLPDRPVLAEAIAHAALVDYAWRAASLTPDWSPVAPLVELWNAGYALSSFDANGAVLEVPPL